MPEISRGAIVKEVIDWNRTGVFAAVARALNCYADKFYRLDEQGFYYKVMDPGLMENLWNVLLDPGGRFSIRASNFSLTYCGPGETVQGLPNGARLIEVADPRLQFELHSNQRSLIGQIIDAHRKAMMIASEICPARRSDDFTLVLSRGYFANSQHIQPVS